MSADYRRVWMELRLLSRANEASAGLGDQQGRVDPQKWIFRHLGQCPKEFAYEDWSQYQPAFRKIRLVAPGEILPGERRYSQVEEERA